MEEVHPRVQGGGALSRTKKVTRLDNRHHVTSDNVQECVMMCQVTVM